MQLRPQLQPRLIPVRVKDEDLKGRYSNLVQVMHTKEEFVLDFFSVFAPAGILVSRIVLSPGHLKRMILALQSNLKKYEAQFEEVEPAEEPEIEPIGFKVEEKEEGL